MTIVAIIFANIMFFLSGILLGKATEIRKTTALLRELREEIYNVSKQR